MSVIDRNYAFVNVVVVTCPDYQDAGRREHVYYGLNTYLIINSCTYIISPIFTLWAALFDATTKIAVFFLDRDRQMIKILVLGVMFKVRFNIG